METQLHVVLPVLCLSVVTVMAFNEYSIYTRVITNWRAESNGAYETQTGVPFMIFCIEKCASNPACTAIDHYGDTCHYFNGAQLNVEDGTTAAVGHTLVYVRDLFVFNAVKTFGSYSLAFPEAQQACGSLGGRLANYTDLETLFDRGYNFCGCGFIDNGDMYMIMQVVHPACGNMIGLYQCTGITMAAAWCYIYPL